MKNILYLILAFILVCFVWGLIKFLIALALGVVIKIGMILLFCALVYFVFKMLTDKQKNVI